MTSLHTLFRVLIVAAIGMSPALAQNTSIPTIDTVGWSTLVLEAEARIAMQVPERVLHDLRYRIYGWQQEAAAVQKTATEAVEQLRSRLALFDDTLTPESIPGAEIESLRQRIATNLNDATTSLLLAEDINQHAASLLRTIEANLAKRQTDHLLTLVASPLYPPAWSETIRFLGAYAREVTSEIATGLATVDGPDWSINRLPIVAVGFLAGLMLLTLARRWTLRGFEGIRVRLSLPSATTVLHLSRLIADAILPVMGVILIVQSFQATDLPGLSSGLLVDAVPWMAAIIYGVRWLATVLFANADEGDAPLGLAPEDHREAVRLVLLLGWIVALERLVRPLAEHGESTLIVETVLHYPFIMMASYLLLRLGRRLSHRMGSVEIEGQNIGYRALHVLARVSLFIAVLAMGLATIGFIPATRLVVFATLNTFAIVAVGITTYMTVIGFYDYVAALLESTAMQYWRGITKIVTGLLLTLTGCTGLALAWGASQIDLLIFLNQLQTGVSYGPITISLTSISIIVAVFFLGLFATRLIQSILGQTILPGTHLSPGTQNALITGTGYVGVVVSGLLAISLAGFNLTNIAIVAGALSVGIGFGLQAIVSNFVSGIILLMEQPVREGDWIQTGSVSGTVKKISFRSTHVLTFDRALIVVPNSDLISNHVTNWTLDNRIGRIVIEVGVAYGSNVEQVLEILGDVVNENESVTQDPPPNVAFMRFGADALEFEIRAILTDVNLMISARSEINVEIERRLTAANIAIPFPQRDLWIRNPEVLTAQPAAKPDNETHKPSAGPAA